jgi:hypothetical protein
MTSGAYSSDSGGCQEALRSLSLIRVATIAKRRQIALPLIALNVAAHRIEIGVVAASAIVELTTPRRDIPSVSACVRHPILIPLRRIRGRITLHLPSLGRPVAPASAGPFGEGILGLPPVQSA